MKKSSKNEEVTVTLTREELVLLTDALNSYDKMAGPVLGQFAPGRDILTRLGFIRHRLLDLFFSAA